MAYLRGDVYIWADFIRVHFWDAAGHDWWEESGWGEHQLELEQAAARSEANDATRPGGVSLRQEVADAYVMMRLAELIDEGRAVEAIDRALELGGGNFGCAALQERAARLREVMAAEPSNRGER
jgi:hypothetical protein